MTTKEIEEAMPFVDFAREASAAVTYDEALAGEVFCELHAVGNVSVLFFPASGTAMVNERSAGVGDSLYVGHAESAEDAAAQWE